MRFLIHRISSKTGRDGYHSEFWELGSAYNYGLMEEKLERELEDEKSIIHYCFYELDREVICKSIIQTDEQLQQWFDTFVERVQECHYTPPKETEDNPNIFIRILRWLT